MEESSTYPKHNRSTVRRLRDRTVHAIFSAAPIVHVSFLPTDPSVDPFPTILPMLGAIGSFGNPSADPATEPLDFYIHGHASSRLMKLPGSKLTEDHPEGLPVCVAATLVDGIKLALTPFNHSCNYRSAVLHGYANLVTDEDEKNWAMHRITDALVPDRWNNTRVPPSKPELQATSVLRITIVSASAKISTGPAGDDRKELQNDDVTSKVWTGVFPVWEHVGPPVESKTNKVALVPEYLGSWMRERNASREEYAVKVASDKI
ncbi:hypothetical protein BJ322DRAFT_494428 [Thelephora terrestris]|uniref:Flavin-nucleotide-binding protein n=1 Tax=Thelephora terrestris TaxID=56493 RepID=A0A9P6L1K9_9AGAM|nr:hypothetical protein BJ322DRAFT_494428 [Thelephora terrestris]